MTGRCGKYLPVAAAALFLAGCSAERESTASIAVLSPDEIIAAVNSSSSSVITYTAAGSVSIETPRMSQSAGFTISVKKPDSVLITVDGPFGITLGKALFTKGMFTAYNALNNTVYQGNPQHSMQSLPFFAGIDPEIVIDAMSGVRRFNNGFDIPDSFSAAGNFYQLSFNGGTGRTQVTVDARSMRIIAVRTFNGSSTSVWEEYYTFTSAETLWRPESVRIVVPEKSIQLEFFFDDIILNPDLPAFVLEFPADADRITIQ